MVCLQRLFQVQYPLLALQLQQSSLVVQDNLLVQVNGDIDNDARPHTFKPTTFKIPTSCSVCSNSLWGINKQAVACTACGTAAHYKCSLRLPPSCSKAGKQSGALSRVPTTNSVTYSSPSVSHKSSVHAGGATGGAQPQSYTTSPPSPDPEPAAAAPMAPPGTAPAAPAAPSTGDKAQGKALYSFDASGPEELSIIDGQALWLIVPDRDESGWVKVSNDQGESGLVPSSYVEFLPEATSQPLSAASGASGAKVRALYDFEASDPDELPLQAGQVVELTPLGRGVAEGWIEGVNPLGGKGIFPASYVEDA